MPSDAAKKARINEKKARSSGVSLVRQCSMSVVRSSSSAVQKEAWANLYAFQIYRCHK